MTLRLRADTVVRAAPAQVFELICTPERLPEWNVSVERARRAVPDQPVAIGDTERINALIAWFVTPPVGNA